ncbi:MAG: histidinol-phosphate aminotransferase family protein [Promethearchaeota archaeon]|nr:MAG: histidinol-phosphate aminotransferase family protein [Candidatus Lokiarchaeota archaeon]
MIDKMKIKLDNNEMPKPPPIEVLKPVKKSLDEINRYTPQIKVNKLVKLISEYSKAPENSIILSSGSDILIKEFIFLFSREREIIIPDPTFFLISNAAQKTSSPLLKIRLREPEFNLSIDSFIDEINKPTLIVFDNPNNPTGSLLFNQKDVEMILENENVILLIDEAYFEFSKISFANLIKDYPNLAVSRTLSKSFGLAGSGIGYLIAGEIIQKRFEGLDIMLPSPSVIAAIHALDNIDYMIKYIEEIDQEKKRIMSLVSDMDLRVYPSYTNFFLMKSKMHDLARTLAEHDVLVSDVSNHYSLSSEYIRVTIGTNKENDYFMKSLRKIMGV